MNGRNASPAGATRHSSSFHWHRRLQIWCQGQAPAALQSLGQLWRSRSTTAMTLAAIGIALTLPATLFTAMDNLSRLGDPLTQGARITCYLKADTDSGDARKLAAELERDVRISRVRLIDPDAGLSELLERLGTSIEQVDLPENPLPWVLIAEPHGDWRSPEQTQTLAADLAKHSEMEQVRADTGWLRRLAALLGVARRAVLIVGTLLGLTVLLVLGNTIRLEIENRREEIAVCKLVGATDGFVRRPFLYGGLWLGLFGGVLAWLLTSAAVHLLAGPVTVLAAEYDTAFQLHGPSWSGLVDLVLTGLVLGWLGAWLAVGSHLGKLEVD